MIIPVCAHVCEDECVCVCVCVCVYVCVCKDNYLTLSGSVIVMLSRAEQAVSSAGSRFWALPSCFCSLSHPFERKPMSRESVSRDSSAFLTPPAIEVAGEVAGEARVMRGEKGVCVCVCVCVCLCLCVCVREREM